MNREIGFNPENYQSHDSQAENVENSDLKASVEDNPKQESSVESREKKNLLSVKALIRKFHKATSKIENAVIDYFKVNDPELDEIIEGASSGEKILLNINDRLQELLQNAIQKPDKEYEHEIPELGVMQRAQRTKDNMLKKKIKNIPSSYNKIKADKLEGLYTESEPIYKEEQEGEKKFQTFVQSTKTESGLILNESISNTIDNDENSAKASLRVCDPVSKKILDLQYLLPKNVKFVPSEMLRRGREDQVINTNKEDVEEVKPNNLKDYKGNQFSNEYDFAFVVKRALNLENDEIDFDEEQMVEYGDLSRIGGMISLLHEIGHSWQNQYREGTGKYPYQQYLEKIKSHLSSYLYTTYKDMTETANELEDVLKEYGVRILPEDVQVLNENRYIVNDFYVDYVYDTVEKNGVQFTESKEITSSIWIESETLTKMIEEYVEEERNAWANAIKILRMLRREGIDLEPKLRTLEDIRNYMAPNLGSYDMSLRKRDKLIPTSKTRKFLRYRPPKEKDELSLRDV